MKRIIIAGLVVISLLAVGCAEKAANSANQSNETTKQTAKAASKSQSDPHSKVKGKDQVYDGIAAKVDVKAKTMIVKKENTDLAFLFDISKTKLNGYQSIKGIKLGDKVAVKYDVKLGKMYAEILTKK